MHIISESCQPLYSMLQEVSAAIGMILCVISQFECKHMPFCFISQ